MSKQGIMFGAKCASVVAAGALLTVSVGPASAMPAPTTGTVGETTVQVAASESVALASWRESASAGVVTSAVIRPSRATAAATARAAQVRVYAKFANFTLHSADTRDMLGVERSLYRGIYFRPSTEVKRLCIVRRESEGHYGVRSASGSYYGAYQVSAPLARGATWMMLREHRKLMGETAAKSVLARLRATPMNKWPRYWQDAAFATIINWERTGSGAAHWAGGRWHC